MSNYRLYSELRAKMPFVIGQIGQVASEMIGQPAKPAQEDPELNSPSYVRWKTENLYSIKTGVI